MSPPTPALSDPGSCLGSRQLVVRVPLLVLYLGDRAPLRRLTALSVPLLRPGLGLWPLLLTKGRREATAIAGRRGKGLLQPVLRAAGSPEGPTGGLAACCRSCSEREGRPSRSNPARRLPAHVATTSDRPRESRTAPSHPQPSLQGRVRERRRWARPAGSEVVCYPVQVLEE